MELVTGDGGSLEAVSDSAPFGDGEELAWRVFGNGLYGIAEGGRSVFRLDVDRARTTDEALVRPAEEEERWLDVTAYQDGLAALRRTAGGTEIVTLDGRSLEPVGRPVATPTPFSAIDSDRAAERLLGTAETGVLWTLDADDSWRRLADGVDEARW